MEIVAIYLHIRFIKHRLQLIQNVTCFLIKEYKHVIGRV